MAYWFNVSSGQVESDDNKSQRRRPDGSLRLAGGGRQRPADRPRAHRDSGTPRTRSGRRATDRATGAAQPRRRSVVEAVDRDGVARCRHATSSGPRCRSGAGGTGRRPRTPGRSPASGVTGQPCGQVRGVEPEPGHEQPAGLQVRGQPLATAASRVPGASSGMTLPGEDGQVEGLRPQLQPAEVLAHPRRGGVALLGDVDHVGVGVDPDAVVAQGGELGGHPAGAAAGVEDADRAAAPARRRRPPRRGCPCPVAARSSKRCWYAVAAPGPPDTSDQRVRGSISVMALDPRPWPCSVGS